MAVTRVLQCTCENKGQDELHGEGNRVFNGGTKQQNGSREFRCTVCGTKVMKGGGAKKNGK